MTTRKMFEPSSTLNATRGALVGAFVGALVGALILATAGGWLTLALMVACALIGGPIGWRLGDLDYAEGSPVTVDDVERAQTRRRVCRLAAGLELTRIAADAEWGTVSEEIGDREQVLRFRASAILAGVRGCA